MLMIEWHKGWFKQPHNKWWQDPDWWFTATQMNDVSDTIFLGSRHNRQQLETRVFFFSLPLVKRNSYKRTLGNFFSRWREMETDIQWWRKIHFRRSRRLIRKKSTVRVSGCESLALMTPHQQLLLRDQRVSGDIWRTFWFINVAWIWQKIGLNAF